MLKWTFNKFTPQVKVTLIHFYLYKLAEFKNYQIFKCKYIHFWYTYKYNIIQLTLLL